MQFSRFANRYTEHSGIVQLMEDLGEAMSGDSDILMLGGGNPAHIPEVQAVFQERLQRLVHDPAEFKHLIGNYDPPRGERRFIDALVGLFNREYGWGITADNVVLTAGSQSAFFLLFNMFAGEYPGGARKRILLPLAPEYIGYADVGLSDDYFIANRPSIETYPGHEFKYFVDFDSLPMDDSIGGICVSRPTNPTGNVLQDAEMARLAAIARERDIPFIVDNAYGMPFPDIIFTEAGLKRDENTILCMSLSKLGLPAARTGIIIASPQVAEAVARMNAIFSLALGSFGPALGLDLVSSGEILRLSRDVVKPYYRRKAQFALDCVQRELIGLDYYVHRAEGAIFLWLWFPGLPVSSEELYQRLKAAGVLVVSGHYFFPGLATDWAHKHECLRVSYAMDDQVVSEGIRRIGAEVRRLQTSG